MATEATFNTPYKNDPHKFICQIVALDAPLELAVDKKFLDLAIFDLQVLTMLPDLNNLDLIAFCAVDMRIIPGPSE